MPPAARIFDNVSHPLPPVLTGGPGSLTVFTGMQPQWRGMPAAAAAGLQAAKQVADAAVKAADNAATAAMGTPGAPAAKAAAEAAKGAALSAMSSMISSVSMGADIHACTTPFPVPPHGPGVVIDGSPTVLVNNLPAARMGDTLLEALGPPNKIATGHPTTLIGGSANSGSPGLGALLVGAMALIGHMVAPTFPRTVVMPDGTPATEFSPNVFVTGTHAEQQEKIRQLNAVQAGPGGQDFLDAQAAKSDPVIVDIIGNPADGGALHPGQQSYENCAVQSSQQIIHQATGVDNNESTMEGIAGGPPPSGYSRRGGTPIGGEEVILENGGVPAHMAPGNTNSVDDALRNNQGVVSGHDAGRLWNDPAYNGGGHAVHTTGGIVDQNGDTIGYTINDTGNNEQGRVLAADDYADSMDGGDIAITDNPIW
ncbi:PAAR domain-containing protein [Vannielia sp.]|uniref:PAAR domain-containing protein n=1 Tax=Vannielia sp. TaxID=2813045 RepID=UPI0026248189|nr:PAAR domain-containing protein [Vannielia sp.]MDF1871399.1 PAAR domain-containing protein [Vannielia sp.]